MSLLYGRVENSQASGIQGLDHEDEDTLVYVVPFSEAYQMLEDGRIEYAIPILALQWLVLHRHKQ